MTVVEEESTAAANQLSTVLFVGTRQGPVHDFVRGSPGVGGVRAAPSRPRDAPRGRRLPAGRQRIGGDANRPSRAHRAALGRWRRHVDRGVQAAGLHPGDRRERAVETVFWLTPGHPGGPGSGTPGRRRRACSAAGMVATPGRPSTDGTTTRCGRRGPSSPTRGPPTAPCCIRSTSTPATAPISTSACPGVGCSRAPTVARTGSR